MLGASPLPRSEPRGPFAALFANFVAQLASASGADQEGDRLRRLIWTVALLVPPGLFLLIALLPEYEAAVLGTMAGRVPAGYVDDLRAWIVLLFTTYAMATTGLVAVLAWEGLTFHRDDWMVLGTLPISRGTIVAAKLSALGVLLAVCALPLNLLTALVFASVTSNHEEVGVFILHFCAFVAATCGASFFAFVTVVFGRAILVLLAGARAASALAVPLQFVSVVALCCLLVFCPFVLDVPFATATFTNWLPSGWFTGLFEVLRGSSRALDPSLPFKQGADRAALFTTLIGVGAIGLSIIDGFRAMRASIAIHSGSAFEAAPIARRVARWWAGPDTECRALADFAVVTLARNRSQRAPLAVCSAIGVVVVIASIVHQTESLEALRGPRTNVLWMPLVVAFWIAIGARASLLVPGQRAPSWLFRVVATTRVVRLRAARAAIASFVLPRTAAATVLLLPLLDWRDTALLGCLVTILAVAMTTLSARSLDHVPFAARRPTAEGALKGKWVLYAAGMYAFAFLPAKLASSQGLITALFFIGTPVAMAVAGSMLLERREPPRMSEDADFDEASEGTIALRLGAM